MKQNRCLLQRFPAHIHLDKVVLDWKPENSGSRLGNTQVGLDKDTDLIQNVAAQDSPEGPKGEQTKCMNPNREYFMGCFPALITQHESTCTLTCVLLF